ncbi:RNA polymerase factor sigma-54 [Lichenihabitans sp. Uapishka_5]|uniref:RNA polymerase factor sigma-54 n=1 Tax=Lichenihabitans sp. Uapishka_5 TaxID=3037302 RepID=UPI0029E7D20F|nr:RNA polymerase factor sigma-54 [Lichenihabitans sp. Uapishka_5]MDX7951415.1 RNA polymerase factor sigma-54 [Lichenihabitans sp. Uapishka_5]
MALSAKLVMRQGQTLVMTPQLLQAIKLLQLSNVELASFIEEELERNPILERVEERAEPALPADAVPAGTDERDWTTSEFATDQRDLEAHLGTELSNSFDGDRGGGTGGETPDGHGLSMTSWSGGGAGGATGEDPNGPDHYLASAPTLADHLADQLALATADPVDRLIGHALIDAIDEGGYLRDEVEAVAERLGAPVARVAGILAVVQTFDPTGIAARDLAECLALQLRDRDRLDPAMQVLLQHLPLLGRRDFAALRKLCGVDDDDLRDMLAEIRALDPKPGRAFGGAPPQTAIPDVYVSAAPDGSWHVELNTDVLPRILVNQRYYARVTKGATTDTDRSFVSNCLQTANWLTKSLEQRARTILKVSSEIIRQQDAFFARGVQYLRPLNLRSVADVIGMHESTVSRVTSNKYMSTPRGLFELKYFFTASIPASHGADAHSAEAVRFRIKQMIDGESPGGILSDDAIVVRLRQANIDIARRTVAKYRESLRIPSSVERRREKGAATVGLEAALAR